MPGPLNRAVVRILAAYTEESSTSQRELARRTGMGQATVSRLLSRRSPMTFDQFELLCAALRVSPAAIIRDALSMDET